MQIVRKSTEYADVLAGIKVPKTWYLSSDGLLNFIQFNHLEDVYNRKYLELDQVRREYPHIIQVFKNSHFSPEVLKGLSLALDDLGDRPLIVRSSSLLEDRMERPSPEVQEPLPRQPRDPEGAARGAHGRDRRGVRLDLRPRSLEYRAERGMLDLHEEMGS